MHRHISAEPAVKGSPAAVSIPTRSGAEWVPRRIYLKPDDFVKSGYTEGCKGCTWFQTGLGARTNHSDDCRKRMEDAFAEDDEGRKRLGIQRAKMDEFVTAVGEKIMQNEDEPNQGKLKEK